MTGKTSMPAPTGADAAKGILAWIGQGARLGIDLLGSVPLPSAPRTGTSCEIPPPCWAPQPLGAVTTRACPGTKAVVRLDVTNTRHGRAHDRGQDHRRNGRDHAASPRARIRSRRASSSCRSRSRRPTATATHASSSSGSTAVSGTTCAGRSCRPARRRTAAPRWRSRMARTSSTTGMTTSTASVTASTTRSPNARSGKRAAAGSLVDESVRALRRLLRSPRPDRARPGRPPRPDRAAPRRGGQPADRGDPAGRGRPPSGGRRHVGSVGRLGDVGGGRGSDPRAAGDALHPGRGGR